MKRHYQESEKAVHLKLTQYCKSTILQFKKRVKRQTTEMEKVFSISIIDPKNLNISLAYQKITYIGKEKER